MKIAKLRIDAAHAVKLIRGEKVAIKVPHGATSIQLELAPPHPCSAAATDRNYFAEVCDVFFNGRRARR